MGNDRDPEESAENSSRSEPLPDEDRGDLWTRLARHHANLKTYFAREFGRRRPRPWPWRLGSVAADSAALQERRSGVERRTVLDRRGGTDRRSGLELRPSIGPAHGAPVIGPPGPGGRRIDRRQGGERRASMDRRRSADRRR